MTTQPEAVAGLRSLGPFTFRPPTLEEELARFQEALEALPEASVRHAAGQKFNAYDIAGDDPDDERDYGKHVCLGPIHSRPLSFVSTTGEIANLLTAALRVASALSSAKVPADVAELVVAARIVAFEDQGPEAIKRLDKASEAFAGRVRWDDEPEAGNEESDQ